MKGRSIAEAVFVFAVFQAILIIPQGIRSLVRWENISFGGSYFSGVLMVALAVFMIILKRYEFKEMGVLPVDWKSSFGYGLRGYFFFILPQCAITFFLAWGVDYKEFMATAVILGSLILALTILMNRGSEVKGVRSRILIPVALFFVLPFILGLIYDRLSTRLVAEFIWNILVGGFIEELFYRGFIQSSINLEFGKTWKIGETKYGPGLLISSLLYSLSRGMRSLRPWIGVFSVSWSWTVFAFTVGIFYGLIREKSGDIISSGSANALIDAIGEAFIRIMS
jgi:membrane protease YdiL (CAAX protease family)